MGEKRINPDTGVIEENQGLFFDDWRPASNADGLQERVNPDTGVHERNEGLLFNHWRPSENDAGHQERTNPDTGVHEQNEGLLFDHWRPSQNEDGYQERTNPDTGVHEQNEGLFFDNWREKGHRPPFSDSGRTRKRKANTPNADAPSIVAVEADTHNLRNNQSAGRQPAAPQTNKKKTTSGVSLSFLLSGIFLLIFVLAFSGSLFREPIPRIGNWNNRYDEGIVSDGFRREGLRAGERLTYSTYWSGFVQGGQNCIVWYSSAGLSAVNLKYTQSQNLRESETSKWLNGNGTEKFVIGPGPERYRLVLTATRDTEVAIRDVTFSVFKNQKEIPFCGFRGTRVKPEDIAFWKRW